VGSQWGEQKREVCYIGIDSRRLHSIIVHVRSNSGSYFDPNEKTCKWVGVDKVSHAFDLRTSEISSYFSSTVKNWLRATRIPLLASRTRRLAKATMIATTMAETMMTPPPLQLPPTAAHRRRRSLNHRAHHRPRRASRSRSSLARHPNSTRVHKRKRSNSIPFKVIPPLLPFLVR
jgi:hypothetical protein